MQHSHYVFLVWEYYSWLAAFPIEKIFALLMMPLKIAKKLRLKKKKNSFKTRKMTMMMTTMTMMMMTMTKVMNPMMMVMMNQRMTTSLDPKTKLMAMEMMKIAPRRKRRL